MTHVDSRGRVLYSAGNEGSVRWWGGKAAKVLEKSAICEGRISVLEMNDDVIVAGYSRQGMQAWDVRTQQPLCTFSNADVGGVRSLQFDNRKLVTVSTTGKVCATIQKVWIPLMILMFSGNALAMVFISSSSDVRPDRAEFSIRLRSIQRL